MNTHHLIVVLACVFSTVSAGAADDGTGNDPCQTSLVELPPCNVPPDAVLPDIMTVVPKHLSIQNQQQQETLRFSNGIANMGRGPWWLAPEFPDVGAGQSCQKAHQIITTAAGFPGREIQWDGYSVACEKGNYDFHETHNHWHIDNIGEFKVCHFFGADGFGALGRDCLPAVTTSGAPTVGIKFTFCLIDWYRLGTNSPSSDPTRNFFDCSGSAQGITPGWVDQYHQATDGQSVNITGLPAGDYVLVSTANVGALTGAPVFEEEDVDNNTSYVVLKLARDSKGNAKIKQQIGACDYDPAHLAQMVADVDEYVATFPEDAPYYEALIEDLCGGKPANR